MITGEIKNKIDAIWQTFWERAGITNPMDVMSQRTFVSRLRKKLKKVTKNIFLRSKTAQVTSNFAAS